MANNVTSNPWILDTPGATVIWTGNAKIAHIEFFDYIVDTDNVLVSDLNGKTICVLNGNPALETERSGHIGWVQGGLVLTTLTAGRVAVFLDAK